MVNFIYKSLFYIVIACMGIICILPLFIVAAASFSNEISLAKFGFSIFPRDFTVIAYQIIFNNLDQLVSSYLVTIRVTLIGTCISLIINGFLAYPLSRSDFKLRNTISFYVFFTMMFSGGIVPLYIVVSQIFHLKDSMWALILPMVANGFYVLLMRTFFKTIPIEIVESAKIDGIGEYRLFFQIIMPLSAPVFATVGLFTSLNYWNDWFLSLLFISEAKLYPLQYLLMTILRSLDVLNLSNNVVLANLPSQSMKMAIALISIGPIIFIYVFFQRFFVRGLTVGAIKG